MFQVPYVEISTMEPKRRVRRNAALNCDETSNQPLCCRYPMQVDFEKFEFDFIIAPKSYNAFMCSGDCEYLTLQRYSHTHIMQMTHPNSISPCCTPRKMKGIDILYFDNNLNVILAQLPGMAVEKCGCS